MTSAPLIFSPSRIVASRRRANRLQRQPGAARFLAQDVAADFLDRLTFLRHVPAQAAIIGDFSGQLEQALRQNGCEVRILDPTALDIETPWPDTGFDLIAVIGLLDTANDLPGALVHVRRALAPGGLALMSFPGAGSVPTLRALMLEADGDRPAARLHPQVDVRAGGQLLQRAGFADPVIDTRVLEVGYRSLQQLVADLRAQGLGNVLARPGPPLTQAGLARAHAAFAAAAENRRLVERYEILTLSGWKR